jgi:hypothetical protein
MRIVAAWGVHRSEVAVAEVGDDNRETSGSLRSQAYFES